MSDGYERRIGRYGGELPCALIAVTGVRPGARVLDVGCGSVALMGLLAGVVGPANVVGVDPDAETVTMAAARLPGVRFDIAPGEALPYGDGEFDGVLAQLVVSLIEDARAGRRRDAVPHGGANSLLPPARAATAHGAHESLPHDGA